MYRRKSLAPFVSSPKPVVRKMLEVSNLQPGETLIDLGSGDGRIPIMAAEEFGARGIGIDINEKFIQEATGFAKALGLGEKVTFLHNDIFEVDLSIANVITIYLTTSSNEKLRPKLEQELRPGTRVVTHDFSMRKWNFGKSIRFKEGYRSHTIYVYLWQ